ncbi:MULTISPECIES: DoxX family protein [Micromonospora]|uniref:DoxX family protein n=1 Tax=Micromonospora solifontis TaxID=2487138 RepID=A0ABX9WGG6_9ACTN|nr:MULTISPECIES: DoxX family protein [Micromonospora]NES16749.1 DoxX family protein [Micromonospora sp. PPF5-17B]NES37683.1 DoxX family protein [Micromonospora solifontis]NES58421.1 DoxX family protein [Micromonospora sp. PPF5-6]RNL98031.1 DoxX family protein [Micromonospora solifontis]
MNPVRLHNPVLSLFRMVMGLLFLCHGLASVFGVLGGNRGSGHAIPAGEWPGWWAALIQVVCGALVLVGLLTRPAALLASGSMAYAYFTVHQPHGLLPIRNGGELAALFCWSFLLIAVFGPGAWALDALLSRTRAAADVPAVDRSSVPV